MSTDGKRAVAYIVSMQHGLDTWTFRELEALEDALSIHVFRCAMATGRTCPSLAGIATASGPGGSPPATLALRASPRYGVCCRSRAHALGDRSAAGLRLCPGDGCAKCGADSLRTATTNSSSAITVTSCSASALGGALRLRPAPTPTGACSAGRLA